MVQNVEALLDEVAAGKVFKYSYFYSTSHPFSQFHEAHFKVAHNGVELEFTCAEQFMMYMKALTFKDTETMKKIIDHWYDPKFYKAMGRQVKNYDDTKWSAVRSNFVVAGNKLKFSQNPALATRLLATKDTILVEASPYDTIWGVGLSADNPLIKNPRRWKGTNLLGFALMDVREQLSLK